MDVTLSQWLDADDDARVVLLDSVLERLPPGYRSLRDSGHGLKSFPQFVHEATGVGFFAIFGGRASFGMTDRRWQRVIAMRAMWGGQGDDAAPLDRRYAALVEPAREVELETVLVGEQPLNPTQLTRLGLSDAALGPGGVKQPHLGALLRAVTRHHWRAPSEAEWEHALRALCGDVNDRVASIADGPRMGEHHELCSDDFHETLAGYPLHGSRGNGHEVLRGRTQNPVVWNAAPAWAEALWPGRHRLGDVAGAVAFRPWVDLVR